MQLRRPGRHHHNLGAPLADFEIGAQTNDNGAYIATLTAYDAGHALLGSDSVNGVSASAPSTVPLLSLSQAGIASVTIASTNDGDGFAIAAAPGAGGGGPAVPEPATWALMLVGFGLAGLPLRRRRGRLS